MKRTASALVILAAVGGCTTMDHGPNTGGICGSCGGWTSGPARVPDVQGPWGQPVAMAAPYAASPPGTEAARAMMARSVPMDLVQASASAGAGAPSQILQAGGLPGSSGAISPLGVPFQPIMPVNHAPGGVAAVGALTGTSPQACSTRTEVRFVGPDRMVVSWLGCTPEGTPMQGHISVPGRYNFVQAACFRLKLSNIPGLPGVDLYPTLEVVPANARTEAFLAHSAVPVSFTNEDFEQVQAGNYLVKVIYLPNPQFQDLAAAGPDEIVSSRLEPGADPIAEAQRRGNILLVIRLGNIDLGLANSPPLDAPNAYGAGHATASRMPGSGLVPGMPVPTIMAGGQPLLGPNGQMLPAPSAPPIGMPGMPPALSGPGGSQGVPTMPSLNSSVPLSRLPEGPMPRRAEFIDSAPGGSVGASGMPSPTTTIVSTDDKPVSKRHWWWPWNGPDK